MRHKSVLVAGLATTLVVVAVICFARHHDKIAADLTSRANQALAHSGFAGVEASVQRGRDIRIDGEVASEQAGYRAAEVVGAVHGVRRVDSRLQLRPRVAFDGLGVSVAEGRLTLSGAVMDQRTRDDLVALARQRFPAWAVVDELEVDPWVDADRDLTGALLIESFDPSIAPGAVEIAGVEMVITGRVESEEHRAAYGRRLAELFAGTGVFNRLEVVERTNR